MGDEQSALHAESGGAPRSEASALRPRTHSVQFYRDDAFLVEKIVRFLTPALAEGGCAVVVATNRHRLEIETALATHLDLEAAKRADRFISCDAAQLMSLFFVNGAIDAQLFDAHVAELVRGATRVAAGRPTHVYGEMVDLLWNGGEHAAVIQLEQLWHELTGVETFSLLCSYQVMGFADDGHTQAFQEICASHSHVAPSEETIPLQQSAATLRTIAELEQKANALAMEVTRRTQSELAYARLLHTEQAARAEAQRFAGRMASLLLVAEELAAARDRAQVAEVIVRRGAEALGALTAGLWLLEGDSVLRKLSVHGFSEDALEPYARLPLTTCAPLTEAARSGTSIFLGSREEYARHFPESAVRVADLRQEAGFEAVVCLPLTLGGRSIGALSFACGHAMEFEPEDRMFFNLLARQAAQALEGARLYEAECEGRATAEVARADTAALYSLSAAVNRASEVEEIFSSAGEAIARGVGTERLAVLIYDNDAVMRFRYWRGLSDAYRTAVEGHSPWSPDTRDPVPIVVEDTETDPAWRDYLAVFRAERIRALAFVPLVHKGRLLGKFMLYSDVPRAFSERELNLTTAIAAHVAHAVTRKGADDALADSYQKEHAARLEAESAIRAREEILSIVSHDLRTPLGVVLMSAETLQRAGTDARADAVQKLAERIRRNAARMTRLIDDLLDFGSIQARRIALKRQPNSPMSIVAASIEMFQVPAKQRQIELEVAVDPALPLLDCDRDRAVQALSNLLSNAVSATQPGGRVRVGAQLEGAEAVFFVADTGPGIATQDLQFIFERYWRSEQAAYKGTGLGLTIAKGIVEAHGGRIWAKSTQGAGSCFSFALPTASSIDLRP